MPIVLIVIGVLLVAASDWLLPNAVRKPKPNLYMSFLGGIVWLVGIILSFMNYKILHTVLLLFGSFVLGAIVGVRKN